jgi:hypothetical protein
MARRTHAPSSRVARRAACRPARSGAVEALLGGPARIYVGGRELDGDGVIDVVDAHGELRDRLAVAAPDWSSSAAALLQDAIGHPARPATVAAFADEVLGRLPYEGFALSSADVCAWLLLRAIERGRDGREER